MAIGVCLAVTYKRVVLSLKVVRYDKKSASKRGTTNEQNPMKRNKRR